jgi:hypothetical protein
MSEGVEGFGENLVTIVTRAIEQASSRSHTTLRAPLDHQPNRLDDIWADDRHYIVKEYLKPDELSVAPPREFRALQLLQPLDVAPRPVFFEPALGPVIVDEDLEEEMWDRRRPSTGELASLAALWLTGGDDPTDGLGLSQGDERSLSEGAARQRVWLQHDAEWTAITFPAGRGVAEVYLQVADSRHEVLPTLVAIPPVLAFYRSDARFANVRSRPYGRLRMVDWEDSGLGDPARDVAGRLTGANQEALLTLADGEALFQLYLAACRREDPSRMEHVQRYLALFPIVWLSLLLGHGLDRARQGWLAGWTINGLPANQRLRRDLARAIVWPDHECDRQLAALTEIVFFPENS